MKKIILISSIIFSILLSPTAFAEDNKAKTGGAGTFNACKHVVSGNTAVCSGDSKDATSIAKNIISILLWVVGIAAVIVIIYAGITFIISAGNPSKISQAKTMLTLTLQVEKELVEDPHLEVQVLLANPIIQVIRNLQQNQIIQVARIILDRKVKTEMVKMVQDEIRAVQIAQIIIKIT